MELKLYSGFGGDGEIPPGQRPKPSPGMVYTIWDMALFSIRSVGNFPPPGPRGEFYQAVLGRRGSEKGKEGDKGRGNPFSAPK